MRRQTPQSNSVSVRSAAEYQIQRLSDRKIGTSQSPMRRRRRRRRRRPAPPRRGGMCHEQCHGTSENPRFFCLTRMLPPSGSGPRPRRGGPGAPGWSRVRVTHRDMPCPGLPAAASYRPETVLRTLRAGRVPPRCHADATAFRLLSKPSHFLPRKYDRRNVTKVFVPPPRSASWPSRCPLADNWIETPGLRDQGHGS